MNVNDFCSGRSIARSNLVDVEDHVKIRSYNVKVIKCGKVVEVCRYESPVYKGYTGLNTKGRLGNGNTTKEQQDENRDKVLSRARKDIRNTVNCNYNERLSKFLTLTFAEDITDIGQANKMFKDFVKRVNYHVFKSKKSLLKYTVVPETHKQRVGVIHYHVVCYNLPYIDVNRLAEIWGHGYIKLNKIDNVDNVGAYICKYLSKEECESFKGKKCYFNSRNLSKPLEITHNEKTSQLLQQLEGNTPKISKTYVSEHRGKIEYSQYVGVSMN